jgi:putative transposase
MSEKYKIYPDGLFFITMTVVGWIDFFTRANYCDEYIFNLNYCIDNKGLKVFAFVIMPSHVHLVVKVENGHLSDVLRDFKSHASKRFVKLVEDSSTESRKEWLLYMFKFFGNGNKHNVKYQFWQQKNHAFDLFSNKFIDQKINYIHANPVKARIVNEPHHYVYSSANQFTEVKLSEL